MKGLDGKKIAIAATRKADAITVLVQKNGGTPETFSIQGKQQLNEEICQSDVNELLNRSFDVVLLTTGIGAETLENTAHHLNCHSDFIDRLRHTDLVIRGSKTLKWLKKNALSAACVSEDGTTENLLDQLSETISRGDRVFLQAYNQDDEAIKQSLEKLGYEVYLSKPYCYEAPDDQTLGNFRKGIIEQTFDAAIFTSKTQVHNLFSDSDKAKGVKDAFNDKVLAVAVGKVTAHELEKQGVTNVFQPAEPKMGAMVVELENYFRQQLTRNQ